MQRLRIGTLGAARITPPALITPARLLPDTAVTAVAARDRKHAEAFAAEHGIPVVHDSYADLIADPEIDAVYNPLPNSLHGPWTLAAIAAGKHVLCEKPFTSNAAEAREVARAARRSGLVVMEAMHYRYHRLTQIMAEQLPLIGAPGADGKDGVRHIHAVISFPLPAPDDIRYSYELSGGAAMDAGCYAIDCIRLLGPGEPAVAAATASLHVPGVDDAMSALLRFPGGATAWLDVSLTQGGRPRAEMHVAGTHGQLRVRNFVHPYLGFRVTTRTADRSETISGDPADAAATTYLGQLRAFAAAVLRGEPFPTTPEHAVGTMELIDDMYRTAGLPLRPAAG